MSKMRGVKRTLVYSLALLLLVFGSLVAARDWMGERLLAAARAEQKVGNINGAKGLYGRALYLGKGDAAVALARMALLRQDAEKVREYAARALALDPADGYVHVLLAYALADESGSGGQMASEHILAECRKAVILAPAEGSIWKSCADLSLRLYLRDEGHAGGEEERTRLREETLHAYRQALRLGLGPPGETLRMPAVSYPDPSFLAEAVPEASLAAMMTAVGLLLDSGRWEESRASWWRVAEASSVPGSYALAAGEVLGRRKRYGEAVEAYRKAVEKAPGDDRAWFGMGKAAEKMGELELAAESYLRANELKSENDRYREALLRVRKVEGL